MIQPLIIENGKIVFIIKYEKLKYIGINKEIIIGKRGVIKKNQRNRFNKKYFYQNGFKSD